MFNQYLYSLLIYILLFCATTYQLNESNKFASSKIISSGSRAKRIAFGTAVKNMDYYPFLVEISFGGLEENIACSGALLSSRIVITSAMCTYYRESKVSINIRIMGKNYDSIHYSYDQFVVNDTYVVDTKFGEQQENIVYFALLKLESPIKICSLNSDIYTEPVKLPVVDITKSEWSPLESENNLKMCTFFGFGSDFSGDVDQRGRRLDGIIIRKPENESIWALEVKNEKPIICPGDEGGPLLCRRPWYSEKYDSREYLYGLSVFGGSLKRGNVCNLDKAFDHFFVITYGLRDIRKGLVHLREYDRFVEDYERCGYNCGRFFQTKFKKINQR